MQAESGVRSSTRVDWPFIGLYIGTRIIAERSELLAETLGEHVFDFFLRNKRAEWEEYRTQVSAFERDRMLPVL